MTVAEVWPWLVVGGLAVGIGWAARAWHRDPTPGPADLADAVTGLGPEREPGERAETDAARLPSSGCTGGDLRGDDGQ